MSAGRAAGFATGENLTSVCFSVNISWECNSHFPHRFIQWGAAFQQCCSHNKKEIDYNLQGLIHISYSSVSTWNNLSALQELGMPVNYSHDAFTAPLPIKNKLQCINIYGWILSRYMYCTLIYFFVYYVHKLVPVFFPTHICDIFVFVSHIFWTYWEILKSSLREFTSHVVFDLEKSVYKK